MAYEWVRAIAIDEQRAKRQIGTRSLVANERLAIVMAVLVRDTPISRADIAIATSLTPEAVQKVLNSLGSRVKTMNDSSTARRRNGSYKLLYWMEK